MKCEHVPWGCAWARLISGRKRVEKLIKDTQEKSDKLRTEVGCLLRPKIQY